MRAGIFIAQDGKPIGRGNNRFDTTRPHLQANLLKTPAHMDIPANFIAGTAQAVLDGESDIEDILTIKHNLPYTPEVLVYFYVVSYDGSTVTYPAGTYSADVLVMSGSLGTAADSLYAAVNSTDLIIRHQTESFGYPGTYTSEAPKFLVRLKYYILSNNSHVESYITRGY
jgi:hypothetical protein